MNELSRGFGDGLVMDGLIEAAGWSEDEIKEGIERRIEVTKSASGISKAVISEYP